MDAIKNAAGIVVFAVFVAAFVLLASRQSPPQTQARRAVDGLISGGTVLSVDRGEITSVTVPASWHDLRQSARDRYLFAIWEASNSKADVRVVDESGVVVQVYTPHAELPD